MSILFWIGYIVFNMFSLAISMIDYFLDVRKGKMSFRLGTAVAITVANFVPLLNLLLFVICSISIFEHLLGEATGNFNEKITQLIRKTG